MGNRHRGTGSGHGGAHCAGRPWLMEERRNVRGSRIGHISTDFGGNRSRHDEVVRVVLLYGFVVVAGANLPVVDGKLARKIFGRITDARQIHEHKVGMTGEAAYEA